MSRAAWPGPSRGAEGPGGVRPVPLCGGGCGGFAGPAGHLGAGGAGGWGQRRGLTGVRPAQPPLPEGSRRRALLREGSEAYRVLLQRLHEQGVPEDESAVLCHLGLLLRPEGREAGRRWCKEAPQTAACLPSPAGAAFIFLSPCLQFPPVWTWMPQAGGERRLFYGGHGWRGQQVTCLSLDARMSQVRDSVTFG